MKAAVLLALVLGVAPVAAFHRPCREPCRPVIAACVAEGNFRRWCRRRILGRCHRFGLPACVTNTTNTTTSSTTSTTSFTTMTTTTTTTTTTAPALADASGTWTFTGTLEENPCGIGLPSPLTAVITVEQDGTTLSGTIGPYGATGSVGGPDTWRLAGLANCIGTCCTTVGFTALQTGDTATGSLDYWTAGCPHDCTARYDGAATRQPKGVDDGISPDIE